MMEAGVEPVPPQNANRLMARAFRRNSLGIRCAVVNSLCSGVLRGFGDMLETARADRRGAPCNHFSS